MTIYKLLQPLLLTDKTAEENDLPNRWHQVGELLNLNEYVAKRLIEKGDIELYVPPKPPVAEKKVKPVKKAAVKEAK